MTVGKGELAAALGWTRPRLELRIDSDPNFPVAKRGRGNGRGATNEWTFDVDTVLAYLGGGSAAPGMPPGDGSSSFDGPAMRNSVDLAGGVRHAGELSARQRREAAQAAMLEAKLRAQRKDLVERAEMDWVIARLVERLGEGLDDLPGMIVQRLGLAEEKSNSIWLIVDDLRGKMIADLRPLWPMPRRSEHGSQRQVE